MKPAFRLALAAAAGGLQTLSFAPVGAWWLQPFTLAVLWWLAATGGGLRAAALAGFVFGLTHFLTGFWWVYVSMHTFGEMPAALAGFATVALAAYMALYPALTAFVTRWLGQPRGLSAPAPTRWSPIVFACAWFLTEFLGRGVFLTGFPWLAAGYAHTDGLFTGWATVFGVYGTSLVMALLAGSIGLAWMQRGRATVNAVLLAAIVLIVGSVARPTATQTAAAPDKLPALSVRLLQGNVPQSMKFEQSTIIRAAEEYIAATRAKPADLIVLPETAFATTPERFVSAYEQLALAARDTGSTVLVGAPIFVGETPYNAVIGYGPGGERLPLAYSKQHLVPFGEFVPLGFQWFVDMMKMPLGNFGRGTADQQPFVVKGVKVMPNVCYEDVFGNEMRDEAARADVLLNVSNLAWFGTSWAMPQHLQIARMRSIELGRPSLRATNTGVTAAIDLTGRVLAELPLNTQGSLDTTLRVEKRDTLYLQVGDWPLLALTLLLLALRFRERRQQPPPAAAKRGAEDVDYREAA
ncbi:apolipoprotein N-acyltransferase [Piscinibacterium candidicorallinum]|uniref:Apolipoprotein N-acyltransferase n=1 Tax=Piscinibacterium candidicorallinum TaxID=1793872 RepID=A0ABV7GX35_9BURK